jgi:hypothetical protein
MTGSTKPGSAEIGQRKSAAGLWAVAGRLWAATDRWLGARQLRHDHVFGVSADGSACGGYPPERWLTDIRALSRGWAGGSASGAEPAPELRHDAHGAGHVPVPGPHGESVSESDACLGSDSIPAPTAGNSAAQSEEAKPLSSRC